MSFIRILMPIHVSNYWRFPTCSSHQINRKRRLVQVELCLSHFQRYRSDHSMANPNPANLFQGYSHAAIYAKYRPSTALCVVNAIVDYLGEKITGPYEKAIDVGCGSGQSTRILANHFKEILGTDVSDSQLKEAKNHSESQGHLIFKNAPAEVFPLEDKSVQLVNTAQAFHWFEADKFFAEVDRVLVPSGVVAIHGYLLPKLVTEDCEQSKALQEIVWEFYEYLFPYCHDNRKMVDNAYIDVKIPYAETVRRDDLQERRTTNLELFRGYLTSWSHYQTFLAKDKLLAESILDKACSRLKEVLNTQKSMSEIELTLEIDYFLLMGRKP